MFKNIFLTICFIFCFSVTLNLQAKEQKPITQKLWQGITSDDIEILKTITLALENKNYDLALSYAKTGFKPYSKGSEFIRHPLSDALIEIVLWKKYSDKIDPKKTSFSDISRFVTDNSFLPNIDLIKRNTERVAIANNIPYKSSEQYFKSNPAGTSESKIYFLQSKIESLENSKISDSEKIKLEEEVKKIISEIWIKEDLSIEEEKKFLTKYQKYLHESDHISKMDRLMWDNKNTEALRIIELVNEDYKKLFLAISELQTFPKYIDNIILSVPRKLRDHHLLLYRRILWYKNKDKIDELIDLMLDLPTKLTYQEKWWQLRRLYAREMIKQKKYKIAYALVVNHDLPNNSSDFWEAEWTTGWISLRFLDQPRVAYRHFENLYKNVHQPVTISRAAYWLAMSSEKFGDRKKAIEWYKVATKYPTFFYGQLAIHKHRALDSVGAQDDIILPKDPDILISDLDFISKSKAIQVAYLLAITGDKTNASKIFEWLINNAKTDGQIAVVMKIVNEIEDVPMSAKISRVAAKRNVFFIKEKFQIVKEVVSDEYSPLVHAIIKQESSFVPTALSSAGAIGFMQLMPATAKLVAKEIGVPYNQKKLASDILYNVKFGSHYIKKLTDRFNGSEMLAIASYNAGPNAVQRWINEFYDPRETKDLDKVVDWIELITYSETRNYVQRVMENLIVYKYLMSRTNYDNVQ